MKHMLQQIGAKKGKAKRGGRRREKDKARRGGGEREGKKDKR